MGMTRSVSGFESARETRSRAHSEGKETKSQARPSLHSRRSLSTATGPAFERLVAATRPAKRRHGSV